MSYFKRLLIFALSALLILVPPAAYATTSVGGWTALDTITAGATNTINATKTAGGKVLQSAVSVAPSAVKVGKHLIKGGGAAALLFAVPQILGEGVDWVLDPANNSIRYTDGVTEGGAADGVSYHVQGTPGASAADACRAYAAKTNIAWGYDRLSFVSVGNFKPTTMSGGKDGFSFFCRFNVGGSIDNIQGWQTGVSPETSTPNEKSIPIDTVAAQVISNAEAGHGPSQEAVKATALEGFAAGEHDAALEAAATEAGTENPPDTTDPEAPAEPFDPAGIISAINALKALLAGILSSITSLSDFMQAQPDEEPDPKDTAVVVDAPIDDFDTDKSYITFAGSCPPNYTASMSIMGNTVPFSFDYAPICTVMSALKPFIVGAGYLTASYIIAGHSRGSRD